MNKGSLYIGTSGWNYDHWKGCFYPESIRKDDWFRYYSGVFDTVEINNSFYKLPSRSAFEKWYRNSPENYTFAVKANRYITHMKKLKDPEEPVSNFMDNITALKDKLGPVLFQLPPGWNRNYERLESFVKALPDKYRYTFEFRNESWWNDDIIDLLRRNNIAFCIFDLDGKISPKEVTADFVYIRLHGPNGAYRGRYGRRGLSGWAGAINSWKAQGSDIYCYFDNDENAYAALDAADLMDMME